MNAENEYLLRAAFGAARRANHHPTSVDVPTTLDGLCVVLNEILLRGDERFFHQLLGDGIELAKEAGALVGVLADHGGPLPDPAIGFSSVSFRAIMAHNAMLVNALAVNGGAEAERLTRRIIEWELRLYAKRLESASPELEGRDTVDKLDRDNFECYLKSRKPEWSNARVTSFAIQPGGFSKITVIAGIVDELNGTHDIVIRAEPKQRMLDLDGMAIAFEYPIICYAFQAGLPVAEPILLETDTRHLGLQFMLSRRMPGRILGTFTGSGAEFDDVMVQNVLSLIARIANTPVDPDSPLIKASHLGRWIACRSLPENTREFIEYWHGVGERGRSQTSPLLNHAVNWLLANIPDDEVAPNLIHGDVGFHNILFEDGQIMALLDWENARYGDTSEELSMFVSSISERFSHKQILEWYHEAGGPPVSEWRLRYFDVYMAMKIVVAAQVALQRVEELPEDNLRLAVFGLRYLHPIGSRLAELIQRAEAVRPQLRRVPNSQQNFESIGHGAPNLVRTARHLE